MQAVYTVVVASKTTASRPCHPPSVRLVYVYTETNDADDCDDDVDNDIMITTMKTITTVIMMTTRTLVTRILYNKRLISDCVFLFICFHNPITKP